jgi:hypothetical protein
MKQIMALVKWTWCKCSGLRENFEKRGEQWICTRCGQAES